ncbi:hypothetical protein ABZ904_34975 [Streptomyces sp. NPDC046900]|uniref:hypothetical protein n=1 Tax=Streptomyces sp. NPDC046900 TaxID=3155473 RepID=UPI0033FAEA1E
MAALLGATVPWLLTHNDKRSPQQGVTAGSNGFGQQETSNSSSGQDSGDATATPVSNNKTLKAPVSQQRGSLKVTVEEVDIEAGRILLHVRVDNGYTEGIHIALFEVCGANDDTGHTYQCDPNSPMPQSVPAGRFVTGVIQLNDFVQPKARFLSLSLNDVWIPIAGAPDSITVDGIKVPR